MTVIQTPTERSGGSPCGPPARRTARPTGRRTARRTARLAARLAAFPAGFLAVLLGSLAAVPPATAQTGAAAISAFFPYAVHKRTLSNGLDVLVIPTPEFKGVLSYNTLVLVGSRNEVEPGKSGLAHLFEHILFRHRWEGRENGYDTAVADLGAYNNASTWFDITYYEPLTFATNLEQLAKLEADRFLNLSITEKIFQTEAGAVLGEYRRIAADPSLKMDEAVSEAMYGSYGYGHTTIGYLEDVQDMPNEYKAAVRFYDDYYRPNNCVLVVAGDVEPARVLTLAEKLYGAWKNKPIPNIPDPAPLGGPKRQDLTWPVDVPPRVQVGYRMPAHKSSSVQTAVGQILPELLTSDTAPLYQKMRFQKQTATALFTQSVLYQSFGPGPMLLTAILYKDKYDAQGASLLQDALDDMGSALDDLKTFSQRADAAQTLEELKDKYAYDLLSGINSPARAAELFAEFYRFERDVNVFDTTLAAVRALKPTDIDTFAKATFVPANQVTITLVPDAAPAAAAGTR